MKKRVYFKDTQVSAAIENHANEQLAKVERFLENEPTPVFIDLTIAPSKLREHSKVELRVKSPDYDLVTHYEHEGVDVYDCINRVIDTMYDNLHEAKRKRIDELKTSSRRDKLDFEK